MLDQLYHRIIIRRVYEQLFFAVLCERIAQRQKMCYNILRKESPMSEKTYGEVKAIANKLGLRPTDVADAFNIRMRCMVRVENANTEAELFELLPTLPGHSTCQTACITKLILRAQTTAARVILIPHVVLGTQPSLLLFDEIGQNATRSELRRLLNNIANHLQPDSEELKSLRIGLLRVARTQEERFKLFEEMVHKHSTFVFNVIDAIIDFATTIEECQKLLPLCDWHHPDSRKRVIQKMVELAEQ